MVMNDSIYSCTRVLLNLVRTRSGLNFQLRSYSGYTLRLEIEAPLITREVLPETYFLSVIMAADAHAGLFFAVLSIMIMWNLVKF